MTTDGDNWTTDGFIWKQEKRLAFHVKTEHEVGSSDRVFDPHDVGQVGVAGPHVAYAEAGRVHVGRPLVEAQFVSFVNFSTRASNERAEVFKSDFYQVSISDYGVDKLTSFMHHRFPCLKVWWMILFRIVSLYLK